MLNRLGRWLRAAGYDTAIAEQGSGDRDLLNRVAVEDRILLTRDRHLAAIAPRGVRLLLLSHGFMDEDARVLREKLRIDWVHAPFTRCLVDNAPLRPAESRQAEAVPEKARLGRSAVRVPSLRARVLAGQPCPTDGSPTRNLGGQA
jgi:uncharacterized protein with PIN domain